MLQVMKTICNRDCPDACGLVATVEDGRVTRLQGDKDHPVTRGFLCHRTSHFLERQYAPDRITQPLLRRGDNFQPIPWDDALDLAAENLTRIKQESGPTAIFHYRSGGSLGLLLLLTERFFDLLGPCTAKRGDICSGAGDAAQTADFGVEDSNDLFDLRHSRHIILWGKNAVVSSPHLLPILREARERGAGLTLIDPVHHQTAKYVDTYIQVAPGADLALIMAVLRLLFERDPSREHAPHLRHAPELRALAMTRSLEAWCKEADVSPQHADLLATQLGDGPTAILVGWGLGRRKNGAATIRGLDALGAVSGNLHVRGGGVSFYFKRRGAFDTSLMRRSPPPRTVCEPLFGEEVLSMRDPPIRAVWVTAGNPVAMLPDSHRVAEALHTREFVVVTDAFMTDTARLAHLILPTPTLLEADDLLGSYGHHFIGEARPVVPPPPGVRSDLEIMQGLAARMGLARDMAGSAEAWKARLMEKKLGPLGVKLESLRAGPIRNPLAQEVLFADLRFPTPDAKVNLLHDLPTPPAPHPDYPLTLMAISTEKSQSSQWVRPPEGLPVVTVHPEAARGLANGSEARLQSALGELRVRIQHDDKQRRDVALMAKGGPLSLGHCANVLIRARTTDMGEGGALYDEGVRLLPVS